jgi:hypothetical protein
MKLFTKSTIAALLLASAAALSSMPAEARDYGYGHGYGYDRSHGDRDWNRGYRNDDRTGWSADRYMRNWQRDYGGRGHGRHGRD